MDHGKFHQKVGNGKDILLWEDLWNDRGTLKDLFPKLYRSSNYKHVTISDLKSILNLGPLFLHTLWTRGLRNWEQEEAQNIYNILNQTHLCDSEDELIWIPFPKGYTTKEGYSILIQDDTYMRGKWEIILKLKVPPKSKYIY